MFGSKQNRRKPNYGRRAKFYLIGAVASATTLCILLHAQAQEAEIARIEAQPQQHKAKSTHSPAPVPTPAIPAGLQIGNRQIIRQDTGPTPAPLQLGGFDLTGLTTTPQEYHSSNKSPLWIDSDQASSVVVCHDSGVLPLDQIGTGDVLSVRVHDGQGNVATFQQRAYKTPYNGAVESPLVSVRLDSEGNLLPLAVVRVEQAEDGSIRVTRDSDFAETLIVHYHLFRAGSNPRSYNYAQNVIIPAGAASAALPVTGKAGDVLTLAAGFSYTPAPAEQSDVIEFE